MPEKLDVRSGASSPSRPIASMIRLDSGTKLLYGFGAVAFGVKDNGASPIRKVLVDKCPISIA